MITQQGPTCPVSGIVVDERIVRVVAGQVVVLSSLAIIFPQGWFAFVLLVDFALRSIPLPRLSPLRTIALGIIAQTNGKPLLTDVAPKLFAARIGFVFVLALTILQFSGYAIPAAALATIMIVFALLESVFAFCVGCIFYRLLF